MAIDIKLRRFKSIPWGFRLVGGSDFALPLTVVKVINGSIADKAGLRVGDIFVHINETPVAPLTHNEVNKLVKHCGNVFFVGVHRKIAEEKLTIKHFRECSIEGSMIPALIHESDTPENPANLGVERQTVNTYKGELKPLQKLTEYSKKFGESEPKPQTSLTLPTALAQYIIEPSMDKVPLSYIELPQLNEIEKRYNSVDVENYADEKSSDNEKFRAKRDNFTNLDFDIKKENNIEITEQKMCGCIGEEKKSVKEFALEQLADVQKQIATLSSLPTKEKSAETMWNSGLEDVDESLQTVLQNDKFETNRSDIDNESQDNNELLEITKFQKNSLKRNNADANGVRVVKDTEEIRPGVLVGISNLICNVQPEMQIYKYPIDDKQQPKSQKRHDVIEELGEQLERKCNTKRLKRAFGPLTPSSERPLVLPGGRRWYRPKDAYNDEFIAETLSAQTELITGTTLGINFMKYQKPGRIINLNTSEVYKALHHLNRQRARGIEIRPPVVPAEADIKQTMHL